MTLVMLLALLLLLAWSAFFSGTETAIFSLNPLHVRRITQVDPVAGERVRRLIAEPSQLLSTLLIGNTVVNILATNAGYMLAEHWMPRGYAELVAIPMMTVLLLLLGEIGPKQLGLAHAERFARFSAPLVLWLVWFFTPLRLMLESTTRRFRHIFKPRGRALSIEEFETVLDISGEEGILNGDELAMIKAVMNLEDLKASDVMTPRVDLIGVDLDDPEMDVVAKARAARRNYLLLYRGQWDEIAGILDVRKFLLDPERRMAAATFPPSYVPESIPLNLLLARFQKERRRIAVVVDEYGGTAGVITRGDILEEISGEIYSEISKPRPLFQSAGPFRWLVDATISLEEINRKLHLQLEAEGVDRLAGWITARTGHMPQQGDVIEDNGSRITVLQMVKQRVTLAQIEKAG